MDGQIIAAIIGACAIIIAALIAKWRSGQEIVTEYVPVEVDVPVPVPVPIPIPVPQEKEGLFRNLLGYAILGVVGAYIGSLYWKDSGLMVGFLIGLLIYYIIFRKIFN